MYKAGLHGRLLAVYTAFTSRVRVVGPCTLLMHGRNTAVYGREQGL